MLSLTSQQRYYLYSTPTDMRKGFAGLSGIVREHMDGELLSGDIFIFINRRRDRIKLLMWDRTGFAMYYKQLEQGTFELPDDKKSLSHTEVMMLLEGVKLTSVRYRKRYKKTA